MLPLILASSSLTRCEILQKAGVPFESIPARIDETAILAAMRAEGAKPRDIADGLAEFKARRVSEKVQLSRLVLGSDQILALGSAVFSKPANRASAAEQLDHLQGQTHHLFSAAVIYEDAKPVWRHVGHARMTMHSLSQADIDAYLDEAWPTVSYCVGGYQAEALGARLFSRIEGDWFSVLGLPLLEILSHLRLRGMLNS